MYYKKTKRKKQSLQATQKSRKKNKKTKYYQCKFQKVFCKINKTSSQDIQRLNVFLILISKKKIIN